jgi:hypothetical protein
MVRYLPFAWLIRHPDLAALALLLLIGALVRVAFLFRAPAFFVGGDSQTYLLPAYDLVRDGNWDLGYRRPPGYPLFLSAVFATLGEDMRALSFVQHLLGLVTVVASYGVGAVVGGRLTGLLVGLGAALSGPLLVYEHYVMSDALFVALVTSAVWALFAARRSNHLGLALAAGVLLGLCWLTRPAALLLLPIVPLAFLGVGGGLRRPALLCSVAALGFVMLAGPWVIVTLTRYGTPGAIGLGNNLIWRVTRNEMWGITRSDATIIQRRDVWPGDDADAVDAARRYVFDNAREKDLPDEIIEGLQRRFGLSEIEADRLLASVAIEAIKARPFLYAETTATLALDVFLGEEQHLGGQGKEGGVNRFANPQAKYESWWEPRIRHIPQPPSETEAAEFWRARAIVNVFQPHRVAPLLLVLCLAGLVAGLARARYRSAAILAVAILLGLLGSAAVSGSAPRFRYPLDPMIWALAAVGALAAFEAIGAGQRQLRRLARRGYRAPADGIAEAGARSGA